MTPNQLPPLSDEQFPDFLTDTDVARIFRHVYGGQQFDSTERMFSAEVEAAVRAKFREALAAIAQQAQEPVAWLYVDTVGERYLCFSRPTGGGAITNLYATPPAPQPSPVDEREAFGYIHHYVYRDGTGCIVDSTWEADGCADEMPHPTHPDKWEWERSNPFYTYPAPQTKGQP